MPNRYIRDGLLDSELVDQLSAEAERLLVRMMVAGDDAGRITGRLDVLRSKCFPLKPSLPLADLDAWLAECEAAGAILRYQFEGKAFIQIAKTQRYGQTVYSKSPWTDGSFRIQFVSRETRDGNKEFVSTSLFASSQAPVSAAPHSDGIATPSAPHSDGIGMGSSPHEHPIQAAETLTSTSTRTNTRTDSAPSAVSESREPSSANAVSPLQAERKVKEQQLLPSPPAAGRAAPARTVTLEELIADGLDRELAAEWLAHRKQKRAPLTPRAWSALKREAGGADYSPAQAVSKALAMGWQGFEASWLRRDRPSAQPRASAPDPYDVRIRMEDIPV